MAHTLIIAEAGVNHNGSMEIAKKLVDAAVDAGADIIKFQTFKADKLVSKDAKKAEYQSRILGMAMTLNMICLRIWSFLMRITRCLLLIVRRRAFASGQQLLILTALTICTHWD